MKSGHYSHSYSKQLTEITVALENGRFIHRRRRVFVLDNSGLATNYDYHIKVEICNCISPFKSLHIHKIKRT
jgi:hypothetical protein